MRSESSAEISRSEKYHRSLLVETEYLAYLSLEPGNVIAVALLTEFAEAVEILTYLRGSEPHFLCELSRRDADIAVRFKVAEKAVIPRKASYD